MSLQLRFQITKAEDGMSIKDFVKRQGISKKTLTATKHRGGQLLVNDVPKTVVYELKEQDELTVVFPEEVRSDGLAPFAHPLDIVFEDEYLLVINKPPGMPCIPSIRHPYETLANALIHYYNEHKIASTIHFVNRLDRDTSGLLVVAKYRHIHHLLTQDMKQIKRYYMALVKGQVPSEKGSINAPIAREIEGNVRRCVRSDGNHALTHYEVLKRFEDMSLVQCKLETGRTHQIRVHLTYLGHPLVGDTLYDEKALVLEKGHLLHSYKLRFIHPITRVGYEFVTELPNRFNVILPK
ncbi:MAG TPA: RluA family pseudouridine synthase [Firmicutes bacterium]|nr:RluA family pseudouridine synthase [Bacillota bacterium]